MNPYIVGQVIPMKEFSAGIDCPLMSHRLSHWIQGVFSMFPEKNNPTLTGWWFGTFFIFPYVGNNHPNWLSYFSEGWPNHQPVKYFFQAHEECVLSHRPASFFLAMAAGAAFGLRATALREGSLGAAARVPRRKKGWMANGGTAKFGPQREPPKKAEMWSCSARNAGLWRLRKNYSWLIFFGFWVEGCGYVMWRCKDWVWKMGSVQDWNVDCMERINSSLHT